VEPALGHEQVAGGRGVDLRDAGRIANHRHLGRKAGQACRRLALREAAPDHPAHQAADGHDEDEDERERGR
jgi:hypothetical protein